MAKELIAQVGVSDVLRESALGDQVAPQTVITPNGTIRGLGFPVYNPKPAGNLASEGYSGVITLPAGVTYTTGLVFYLPIVDDGSNSADLGATTVFGITIKNLSNSSTANASMSSGAGTETVALLTMPSISGVVNTTQIGVLNANMQSAGAGSTIGFKIRRISSTTTDTVTGRVILLPFHISNT